MNHLTRNMLFEAAEEFPSGEITDHLLACEECRVLLGEFRKINTALKRMPLERPSRDFTEHVLTRLGILARPSIGWMMLKNLAPIILSPS